MSPCLFLWGRAVLGLLLIGRVCTSTGLLAKLPQRLIRNQTGTGAGQKKNVEEGPCLQSLSERDPPHTFRRVRSRSESISFLSMFAVLLSWV